MSRIQTIKNDSKLSYAHLTKYHQIAYGKHINVMLKVEGSAEKVIEKLILEGVPARLHYGDAPLLDGGDS
jgi:phage replication initiation protein